MDLQRINKRYITIIFAMFCDKNIASMTRRKGSFQYQLLQFHEMSVKSYATKLGVQSYNWEILHTNHANLLRRGVAIYDTSGVWKRILRNFVCPWHMSQLFNRFEISHRARQWYCHTLCKILQWLHNDNVCYGWEIFREGCVSNAFWSGFLPQDILRLLRDFATS